MQSAHVIHSCLQHARVMTLAKNEKLSHPFQQLRTELLEEIRYPIKTTKQQNHAIQGDFATSTCTCSCPMAGHRSTQ